MSTQTAIAWDLSATDEKVVTKHISWAAGPVLAGEPESVLKSNLRTHVEPDHYAPGGKYRCKSCVSYLEMVNHG